MPSPLSTVGTIARPTHGCGITIAITITIIIIITIRVGQQAHDLRSSSPSSATSTARTPAAAAAAEIIARPLQPTPASLPPSRRPSLPRSLRLRLRLLHLRPLPGEAHRHHLGRRQPATLSRRRHAKEAQETSHELVHHHLSGRESGGADGAGRLGRGRRARTAASSSDPAGDGAHGRPRSFVARHVGGQVEAVEVLAASAAAGRRELPAADAVPQRNGHGVDRHAAASHAQLLLDERERAGRPKRRHPGGRRLGGVVGNEELLRLLLWLRRGGHGRANVTGDGKRGVARLRDDDTHERSGTSRIDRAGHVHRAAVGDSAKLLTREDARWNCYLPGGIGINMVRAARLGGELLARRLAAGALASRLLDAHRRRRRRRRRLSLGNSLGVGRRWHRHRSSEPPELLRFPATARLLAESPVASALLPVLHLRCRSELPARGLTAGALAGGLFAARHGFTADWCRSRRQDEADRQPISPDLLSITISTRSFWRKEFHSPHQITVNAYE